LLLPHPSRMGRRLEAFLLIYRRHQRSLHKPNIINILLAQCITSVSGAKCAARSKRSCYQRLSRHTSLKIRWDLTVK
uniref:Uncharacterized protein n=2 Tax=Aegilops tauschii subsp. strangulata TaxID=200361 RepID=A0A453QEN8_AEGTS